MTPYDSGVPQTQGMHTKNMGIFVPRDGGKRAKELCCAQDRVARVACEQPAHPHERFPMDEDRGQHLREMLAQLKLEHRDLDAAIADLEQSVRADQLQIKRLKKQKLGLKDKIAQAEDELFPDDIA
jgi:hypothetical protein